MSRFRSTRPWRSFLVFYTSFVVAIVAGGDFLIGAVHAEEDTPSKSTKLPDLRPNQDWQVIEVPENKDVGARAWSDAAAGCHLAVFSLPVPAAASSDKIIESLRATMAKSDYELTNSEGELSPPRLGLTGFGVTGIASLLIAGESNRSAQVLACYWNEREPSYCRSLCEEADDKLRRKPGASAAEKQQ